MQCVNGPVLNSVVNYKDHPRLKAIENISKPNSLFKFSNTEKEEILNKTVNIDAANSCQDTDVPTKIIKENAGKLQTLFTGQLRRILTKVSFYLF